MICFVMYTLFNNRSWSLDNKYWGYGSSEQYIDYFALRHTVSAAKLKLDIKITLNVAIGPANAITIFRAVCTYVIAFHTRHWNQTYFSNSVTKIRWVHCKEHL